MAHYIGIRCVEAGNAITEVISTNEETGNALAQKLKANFLSDYTRSHARTFLLAIPDDAIRALAKTSFFHGKKVIHTSGGIGLREIENLSENIACLWPIFSIHMENLPTRNDIPFVLQSTNPATRKTAVSLAKCLTNNLTEASDEQKSVLHLSAVLVNNFTNHLFAQSEQLLKENNLSFDLMKPIIQNTVDKLKVSSPKKLQTGPAIRGDQGTIDRHLEILKGHPTLAKLYKILSQSIKLSNSQIN